MRRAIRWSALAAVLVVIVAASAVRGRARADDAKVDGDLKKLQGTWVRAGEDGPDLKWVFEGETLKASVNGADYNCTIKLDEKAAPRTADLVVKDGPGDTSGKTSKAIYKFDDEKFVIAVTMPGADSRPSKFQTVEDEVFLFTMKKEK